MEGNGSHRRKKAPPPAVPPELRPRPGREVAYSVLGYNKVWFTRHALQRMKQRRVTQREVFLVLEQPSQKGLKTQVGRQRWRRNRTDVVFEMRPDELCIVTVIVI